MEAGTRYRYRHKRPGRRRGGVCAIRVGDSPWVPIWQFVPRDHLARTRGFPEQTLVLTGNLNPSWRLAPTGAWIVRRDNGDLDVESDDDFRRLVLVAEDGSPA